MSEPLDLDKLEVDVKALGGLWSTDYRESFKRRLRIVLAELRALRHENEELRQDYVAALEEKENERKAAESWKDSCEKCAIEQSKLIAENEELKGRMDDMMAADLRKENKELRSLLDGDPVASSHLEVRARLRARYGKR